MYNFDNAINRSNTNSVKWDKEAIKGICGNENAFPFWVADMDLETSSAINKAINNAAEFGVVGYPKDGDSLVPLFAEFVKQRHNYVIDENLTTYTQGMLHGIALAVSVFSAKKDGVYVPTPCYRPFHTIVDNLERRFIPSPLSYSNGSFSLDKERFLKDSKDAKIILFCSPHNPSGVVFSKEELAFVLKTAKERKQLVISDEIHADLTHPSITHYPMGLVNEEINADCITFFAPSKTFNVAGEHFGMAVFSSKALFDSFKKAQEGLWLTSPGYFALEIGKAAYSNSLDHNRELSTYLEENKNFIKDYLAKELPSLKLTNAEASFVCFIDCKEIMDKVLAFKEKNPTLFPNEAVLSHFFGTQAGLCFNDGTWFGPEYGQFIRFNYGTSRERVSFALNRMKEAIDLL